MFVLPSPPFPSAVARAAIGFGLREKPPKPQ